MKNLTLPILFLFLSISLFQSCSTTNECDGDCLFSGKALKAEVIYLNCFAQFGLLSDHPQLEDRTIIALPSDLPKKYQTEGTRVQFSGGFYENKLIPNMQFPDPISLDNIYQVDIWEMNTLE